jgi:hypothetical protein
MTKAMTDIFHETAGTGLVGVGPDWSAAAND